jgi:hypothetical protein
MTTPYRTDTVQPLTDDEDVFAHRDYADALLEAVTLVPSPFTIGLFGPWGSGKSSILKEVGERLGSRRDTAYAYFDVWRYEGDPLRREFIRDVAAQLDRANLLKAGFNLDEHTERFEADVSQPRSSRLAFDRASLIRGLAFAALSGLVVLAILWLGPKLGASEKHAERAAIVFSAAALTFLITAFGNVIRADSVQVTYGRLEDPDQFAANFVRLLKKLRRKRLVIGIDNLDRCAPNRVAELLATIKTFLEPAVADRELLFIVAADDAALRRHLIAQELAESGGRAAVAGTENGPPTSVPREVQDAVDEYLRKFFNGSLHVVEVLDEDIRDFARLQLAEFKSKHELNDDASGELIELIGSALKRNPRRIKQFINNLELRLQVLEQRKTSGRVQLMIDPLVVAKLAIIEEQWPDRHKDLIRDPRLLQRWHREAGDTSGDEAEGESEPDRDWLVFLRLTESIRTSDLRPYLTLKQSTTELQLPRYREFADMLEGGELDAVGSFLEDSENAGKREDYLDSVPELFGQAVHRGFYGAGSNIVRAVIGVPGLSAKAAQILDEALPHPQVRRRLAELAPESLIAAAEGLGTARFDQVVGILLDRFEATDEGASADRADVSAALRPRIDRLSQSARSRITRALGSEEIRRDFGSYLPVAIADPHLLPADTIKDAAQALESSTPFGSDEPAYEVAKARLVADKDPAYADIQRFGNAVVASLFRMMPTDDEHDRYKALAADASEVIGRFDVPQTSFADALARFDTEWSQIPPDLKPAAFRFMGALLDAGTEASRDQYAEAFTNRFFDEALDQATLWAEERGGEFGRAYSDPVPRRLAILAARPGGDELADRAATLIARLPTERASVAMAEAVSTAIASALYERAGVLLAKHRPVLGDSWSDLVDRLVAITDEDPATERPGLVSALVGLELENLAPEQAQKVGGVLGNAIVYGHSNGEKAFTEAVSHRSFATPARQTVRRVFDHVIGNQEQLASLQNQIDFVVREQARLTDSQRFQLATALVERMSDHPPDASTLAPLVSRIADLDPDERHGLVTRLILVERSCAEQGAAYSSYREPVLRAARQLAGTHASRAKSAVDERLIELEKGSEEDKALIESLTE